MSKTDPNLIKKYDQVYSEGEEKFWTFDSTNEQNCILRNVDFEGKTVIEIGCGTGDMAFKISQSRAQFVRAIDESARAIVSAMKKHGEENLSFCVAPMRFMIEHDHRMPYDRIVMIGVLEHMDDPAAALQLIADKAMKSGSILAFSCPCHLNPRGYIWAALQILFDVPMSLTDKHMISPSWVIAQAKKLGLEVLKIKSVDQSWGYGQGMIDDYEKRLFVALVDFMKKHVHPANPAAKADDLIQWLKKDIGFHKGHGANAVYFLRKPWSS